MQFHRISFVTKGRHHFTAATTTFMNSLPSFQKVAFISAGFDSWSYFIPSDVPETILFGGISLGRSQAQVGGNMPSAPWSSIPAHLHQTSHRCRAPQNVLSHCDGDCFGVKHMESGRRGIVVERMLPVRALADMHGTTFVLSNGRCDAARWNGTCGNDMANA